MLCLGEDANRDFCKKCKTYRWKAKKKIQTIMLRVITKMNKFMFYFCIHFVIQFFFYFIRKRVWPQG